MDNFNVPRKVNRHVLKALNVLSGGDLAERISTSLIMQQVKYQMRNLVPVPNIDNAIYRSLNNLSNVGLVERRGVRRFGIGRCFAVGIPPPSPQAPKPIAPGRRLFYGTNPRKGSRSILDPNLKRNHRLSEEDSMSGDDFERTQKRLRSNNKNLRHSGRSPYLPGARQHKRQNAHNFAAIDMPAIPQNLYILHHPQPQTHSDDESQYVFESGSRPRNQSKMDFTVESITPVPSLEITDITEGMTKIVDVRQIVETPPSIQQEAELENSQHDKATEDMKKEDKSCENEKEAVVVDEKPELPLIVENNSTILVTNISKHSPIDDDAMNNIGLQISPTRLSTHSKNETRSCCNINTPSCTSHRTESTPNTFLPQECSKTRFPVQSTAMAYIK